MAIRLIIKSKAKPGMAKAYAEAFAPIMKETNREPGCEQYELFQSTLNPESFALMERWTDQKSLDAHMLVMRARDMSANAALRDGEATRERYEI